MRELFYNFEKKDYFSPFYMINHFISQRESAFFSVFPYSIF